MNLSTAAISLNATPPKRLWLPLHAFLHAQNYFLIAFWTLLYLLLLSPGNAADAGLPNSSANNSPLDQEIWKKSQSLRPQPSIDTEPVLVSMGSNKYLIPRNYLTYMAIPTIKVAIPDLRPLTEKTRACFGSILEGQQAGCASIEFRLYGPSLYTPQEMLENLLRGLKNTHVYSKPFGYDLYEIGPENGRLEVYTKEDGKNFINVECHIFNNNGKRAAVCSNIFVLDDGNTMKFFSDLDQLASLPTIEAGIRRIMESFRVKEGSK